ASTEPRSTSARRQVASGSALLLEESSAVTTKRPSRNRLASRLTVATALPAPGRDLVTAVDEVDPRGGALQLPVHRFLQMLDVIDGLGERRILGRLRRAHDLLGHAGGDRRIG